MRKIFIAFFMLMPFSGKLLAAIKLPEIIASHMVLKQKSEVALWGTETPGVKLSVVTGWNKKKYETVADEKGNWKIMVSTPTAGGPYQITFQGSNKIELNDVLIGEVWFSAGQSNMAWRVRQDAQSKTAIPNAVNSQIRLFKPGRKIAEEEMSVFSGKTEWMVCTPETVREFSAMSYYFAVELQKKLNVPVGIINTSWGGTPIESWMPEAAVFSDPVLQKCVSRWKKWANTYEADSLKYTVAVQEYEKAKSGAKPKLPQSMYMISRPHRKYSVLYNGMVAPCTPYTLSGILWYQGTSNVSWADEYELQLNALIKYWRQSFNNDDLPVIVGQLTAYNYGDESKAYTLRNAQLNQRHLKNAYVFCSMDLGDLKDVHPTNKQPYGLHFAGLALNKVYGKKDAACAYPVFKNMVAEGNKLVINFDDAPGLYIKDNKLTEIYIAGTDEKFVPAEAILTKNNQLVVYSSEIHQPRQVRYLYKNTSDIRLYNKDNLPAFPFVATLK